MTKNIFTESIRQHGLIPTYCCGLRLIRLTFNETTIALLVQKSFPTEIKIPSDCLGGPGVDCQDFGHAPQVDRSTWVEVQPGSNIRSPSEMIFGPAEGPAVKIIYLDSRARAYGVFLVRGTRV